MTAKEVERALQGYDHALRLRWSKQRGRWMVERKVTHGRFNLDRPYHPDSDRYYHIRDGYIPVGTLPPYSEFYHRHVEEILSNLAAGDIWRHGGADKMNDQMDLELAQEQERIYQINREETRDEAGETYEHLAWAEGRRVQGVDIKE